MVIQFQKQWVLVVMMLAVSSTVTACGEEVSRDSPYVDRAASVKQEANTACHSDRRVSFVERGL